MGTRLRGNPVLPGIAYLLAPADVRRIEDAEKKVERLTDLAEQAYGLGMVEQAAIIDEAATEAHEQLLALVDAIEESEESEHEGHPSLERAMAELYDEHLRAKRGKFVNRGDIDTKEGLLRHLEFAVTDLGGSVTDARGFKLRSTTRGKRFKAALLRAAKDAWEQETWRRQRRKL